MSALKVFAAAVLNSRPEREVLTQEGILPKAGPEHAFENTATLCGIQRDQLIVTDRPWSPLTKPTCTVCRAMFETTHATSGIPAGYPYNQIGYAKRAHQSGPS